MRRPLAALLGGALAAIGLAAPGAAEARSQRDLRYHAAQVWPALVRFLRVDERLAVVEKDAEAGYVLFELTEKKRTFAGAAEVIALPGEAVVTRVVIRIRDRPSYMEEGLLDRLAQKLKDELGEPPQEPRAREPTPPREKAPAKRR